MSSSKRKHAETADNEYEYIVLCAIEEEAKHVRSLMHSVKRVDDSDFPFQTQTGTLAGQRVRLIVSNIGLSHAAACTSAALLVRDGTDDVRRNGSERAAAIFNVGCAGAHDETLCPGDVVVCSGSTLLDARKVLPDGCVKPAGFRRTLEWEKARVMPCHEGLVKLALGAGKEIGSKLPCWPGARLDQHPAVVSGIVGSSDTWTQSNERIRELARTHGTVCEEMEAASIACTIALLAPHVPFLAIKDISNNELLTSTNPDDGLDGVLAETGKRAALVLEALLGRLPKDPTPRP